MNVVYTNLLTEKECTSIANGIFFNILHNRIKVEHECDSTNHAKGYYDFPPAMKLVDKLDKIIKKDYGDNIVFENNYTRMYTNECTLDIHVDRKELDITLSVCVFSNLDFQWHIFISKDELQKEDMNTNSYEKYKKNFERFETPVGTGVACNGKINPHWRDPLYCSEEQSFIQSFFHWRYKC